MHPKLAVLAVGAALLAAQLPTFKFKLFSAEPREGSVFADAPPRVRLIFGEAIDFSKTKISITGIDGKTIILTPLQEPRRVSGDIVAKLPPIPPGAYRVAYEAVSAKGVALSGTYMFAFGPSATLPIVLDTEIIADPGPAISPSLQRIVELVLGLTLAGLIVMWLRTRKES